MVMNLVTRRSKSIQSIHPQKKKSVNLGPFQSGLAAIVSQAFARWTWSNAATTWGWRGQVFPAFQRKLGEGWRRLMTEAAWFGEIYSQCISQPLTRHHSVQVGSGIEFQTSFFRGELLVSRCFQGVNILKFIRGRR